MFWSTSRVRGRRVDPKSSTSRRFLVIPPPVVSALRRLKTSQLATKLRAGQSWVSNPWSLVFTSELGGAMSRYVVTREFKRDLSRAELRPIRFHDLRHATATFLLVQGIPMKVVQVVLGHSQYHVTANTYSHVLPELQRDAAERMGELLWGVS